MRARVHPAPATARRSRTSRRSRSRRTTFASVLAVATAVALALVGPAAPALAIANGEPVPEGQYRFSAKLTMTDIPRPDGTHSNSGCSGALIAPRWVITAGHCIHDIHRHPVSGPVPYPTAVTLGVADSTNPHAVVVDAVSAVQSPVNDIALLRLAHPVRGIRPLDLDPAPPQPGEILRITGWGALSDVNATPATHLQTGQVTVDALGDTTFTVVGHAPAPDTSACLYDSGAPYFRQAPHHRPRLVGTESDGPSCPHTSPETLARADILADWIRTTTDE